VAWCHREEATTVPNALDSTEVVVGGNGAVYVAPVGTALPTSVLPFSTLNAAFRQVGYTSEDGVTFTDGKTIEDVRAWQAFYPIRKIITEKESSIEFVMRQWNQDNVVTAFGGGTIVEMPGGVTKYLPPGPGDLTFLAMVVEWTDGTNNFRLVLPRGQVTGEVSANVTRTSAADLPIKFDVAPVGNPVAGQDSTQPWFLLTDAFVVT
jgi:hypothetical protein